MDSSKLTWCHIDYLIVTGGSGSTRVYLEHLPTWLDEHPGYMIIRIKQL